MGSFAKRRRTSELDLNGSGVTRREALALAAFGLAAARGSAFAAGLPEGQLTWGIHVSLAPTWFDPAETPGIITPFMVLYALHDGMVKPMPGKPMAPSLAESWSGSEDGVTYDFVLRNGAKIGSSHFSIMIELLGGLYRTQRNTSTIWAGRTRGGTC